MHFVALTPHTTHHTRTPHTHTLTHRTCTPTRTLLPLCCQLARLTTPVGRCGCCLLSAERGTHRDRRTLAIARERYLITTPTCFAVLGPTCGRELNPGVKAARGLCVMCVRLFYTHNIQMLIVCGRPYKKAAAPVSAPGDPGAQHKLQQVSTDQWHAGQLMVCMCMSKGINQIGNTHTNLATRA